MRVRSVMGIASGMISGMTCCMLFSLQIVVHAQSENTALPKIARPHDLAEARQWILQAEQEAGHIVDKGARADVMAEIAIGKARANDYEGARLIARTLAATERVRILAAIALQQALQADYDASFKTIGELSAADERVQACTEISDELTARKKIAQTRKFLDYAQKAALSDDQHKAFDFLSIGRSLAIAGRPTETSAIASGIKIKGDVAEDLKATLFTMAKSYNSDVAGARTRFALIHSPVLRIMALETIVTAQLRAGDKAGAAASGKQVIEIARMGSLSPAAQGYEVAQLQHANGDPAGALETLHTLLEATPKTGMEQELSLLAAALGELGDPEKALKTIETFKDPLSQADTRQAIATARAKGGDVTGALTLAPMNSDPYTKTKVLLGVAEGILESLLSTRKGEE